MTEPTKTLSDCQHDAVLLHGMLEAIDFIENEGSLDSGPHRACHDCIAALRTADQ